ANGTGQTATLTLSALARNPGATVNFSNIVVGTTGLPLGGGSNTVNITSVAGVPLVNGILPFAIVTGTHFATYSGGANSVAAFSGYGPTLAGATATSNVKLNSSDVVPVGGLAINALIINGTLSVSGGTLTVGSGGILTASGT